MGEIVGADIKPPSPWLRCKPEGLAVTRDWLVSKSEGKMFIISSSQLQLSMAVIGGVATAIGVVEVMWPGYSDSVYRGADGV